MPRTRADYAIFFFAFRYSIFGGGGGVGSLGLPSHTDLLKRPLITGGCHLLLHTVTDGFSAVTVATLTALKWQIEITLNSARR